MSKRSPITLEALEVLDAIARRGSFAQAAEELGKVPSAISYIVQQLEERLGVTVFTRQGRNAVLTPAGNHLLAQGRQILGAVGHLGETTRSIASGWETRLRIGIDSMYLDGSIFRIFERFLSAHSELEIDLREEVMSGAWETLIDDDVDLLIGAGGPVPQHKGIHAVAIARLDRVFAVSCNHPLARMPQPIAVARLAQERTVVVHDSARQAIPWTKGLLTESRYFYVTSVESKIQAQLAGIGIGHLPRHRVQHHLDSGQLVEIAVDRPHLDPSPEMYLAWKLVNRGKGLSALKDMILSTHRRLNAPLP